MSQDAPKSFVPNVAPKNDAREQARLQAQIGNMRQQNSQFIVNDIEKKYTLEKKGQGDEKLDLSVVPAVYFSGCKKSEYVVDHRTSKILIESCEDCMIEINGKILTACVEIWKCKNVHLKLNTKVKTLQADIMTGLKVTYATQEDMQTIVWQDVDTLDISFVDNSHPQLLTGHAHMASVYPDSDMKIDQFIIRFVPELGPGLQPERCVRLKNGFLSTEREAADWDRRNEKARDLFVENFLKESGIHLNKDKSATKKIPPNSICACGSKKKYKNCCSNKKAITGLHDTQKPKVYVQDKDGVKVETKENETNAPATVGTTTSTPSTSSSVDSQAALSQTKTEQSASKSKSKPASTSSSSQTTSTEKVAPTANNDTQSAKPAQGKSKNAGKKPATAGSQTEAKGDAPKEVTNNEAQNETPTQISAVTSSTPAQTNNTSSTPSVDNNDAPVMIHTSAVPKKKKPVKKASATSGGSKSQE